MFLSDVYFRESVSAWSVLEKLTGAAAEHSSQPSSLTTDTSSHRLHGHRYRSPTARRLTVIYAHRTQPLLLPTVYAITQVRSPPPCQARRPLRPSRGAAPTAAQTTWQRPIAPHACTARNRRACRARRQAQAHLAVRTPHSDPAHHPRSQATCPTSLRATTNRPMWHSRLLRPPRAVLASSTDRSIQHEQIRCGRLSTCRAHSHEVDTTDTPRWMRMRAISRPRMAWFETTL